MDVRPARGRRWPKTVLGAVLTAAFALAAGCGAGGGGSGVEQARDVGGRGQSGSAPVSVANEGAKAPNSRCEEKDFVASAESDGGKAGTTDWIGGTRFQVFDDYERLLIDFSREGKEAGVPRWSVESPDQGGYVRLGFPGAASTATHHEDLVGTVLDEYYVVRDSGGGLFVDVFAHHRFRYRVTEKPGRLALDLCGVREEIDYPPATGDRAVVLQPREAEEVESPVGVRGYAWPFGGRLTVSILDRERETIASRTVRAGDRTSGNGTFGNGTPAWGLFEATIETSGYEGLATVRVVGRSQKDGPLVGTETEVFLKGSGSG